MKYILPLLIIVLPLIIWAQPINDDCANAIPIMGDISNYCSNNSEFTNVDATQSNLSNPVCWNDHDNDVWFSFVAQATDITIIVNGASGLAGGGSITTPQAAIYINACDINGQEIGCVSDTFNGIVELYEGGLIVGATYFIRIDGLNGSTGTFQLCLNNYNPPIDPGSDCPEASVLCNKDGFVVQSVTGAGQDNTELDGAPCFGNNGTGVNESNSTWFSWVCDQSGSLTFDLSPLNASDDLDFILYELPNGIDDCTGKLILRCMASGQQGNVCVFPTCPCLGVTGLNLSDTDLEEDFGCADAGDDSYAQFVNMTSGTAYALVVNNFSSTGNGFGVEFGGTGTFLGPLAGIISSAVNNEICYGENIVFTDASTFAVGAITDYAWSFSQDATPNTASGVGPHNVTFNEPGTKPVVLTLTTDLGCIETIIEYFEVDSCCSTVNAVNVSDAITDLDCAHEFDGAIDLTPLGVLQPYTYQWSNSQGTEDIFNLGGGDYLVTITNDLGCQKVEGYTVDSPPFILPQIAITQPTCDGGQDGAIVLNTIGGVPPYQYNWNNTGFTNINSLINIPIGTYNVVIRDAFDCLVPLNVDVTELVLELNPDIEAVTIPTCFGDNDGSITLQVNNGLGPYQFDWNDGFGFVNDNTKTGLTAGQYVIDVLDANNCIGSFTFDIIDYPAILLNMGATDVSCFGESDGIATVQVSGGLPGYDFLWSNNGVEDEISGLVSGNYQVSITDAHGCETIDDIFVDQPNEIFVDVMDVVDVVCFGDTTGYLTILGSGGTPDYTFSLDGMVYQDTGYFSGLSAGTYTLFVKDANGCVETGQAMVGQPLPLLVSAGADLTIKLGYDAQLQAIVSPAGTIVNYSWSPPEFITSPCIDGIDCNNVTVKPQRTTTYLVEITDLNGCTNEDKVTVTVVPERPIFIPNIFTPNNDGENDFFTIFGGIAATRVLKFKVFDRWGAEVFSTTDMPLNLETEGWNGRFHGQRMHQGVYVYYAEILFYDDEVILYKGDVTLVR